MEEKKKLKVMTRRAQNNKHKTRKEKKKIRSDPAPPFGIWGKEK